METERQRMDVDIVCVGFGPATAGFLHRLSGAITDANGQTLLESKAMSGMPLQIMCYERADDIGFGVSGVVSKARGIRESLTEAELSQIPMLNPVTREEVFYLMNPQGASRRSGSLKFADKIMQLLGGILPVKNQAFRFPFIPPFLNKHGGKVFSIGQFLQWVGSQLMSTGLVQIWPGMPVKKALLEDGKVVGVRLLDQGTDKKGEPSSGYMPGMDIYAALTVVGDGPVGSVGMQLNEQFGLGKGKHQRDWAVGMKAVVDLPEQCSLQPGTVIHTLGYPEPEIFGFLYVMPEKKASLGIFVPSWYSNPAKNCYRYLQHWMRHPTLWQYLNGATLKSWGAKSIQEDGPRGEPPLAGEGYARIGEGSGSTNILTNSGVDEAWKSGILLADGVIQLLKQGEPFTKENLEMVYVEPRRRSWLGVEAQKTLGARDGFQKGFIQGMLGTALAGFSKGKFKVSSQIKTNFEKISEPQDYFRGILTSQEIEEIRRQANANGSQIYDAIMDKCGWPKVEYDGKLFISHQDALLLGGKVQAPAGYADHVIFLDPELCRQCSRKLCIEMCSGQAITPGEDGIPLFDREKCIHCGACYWNCTQPCKPGSEKSNIDFGAGTGGLHSAEN